MDSDREGQYVSGGIPLPQFNGAARVATPPQYEDDNREAADEHARVKYAGGHSAVVSGSGASAVSGVMVEPHQRKHAYPSAHGSKDNPPLPMGLPPQPPRSHPSSPEKRPAVNAVNHIAKLNVNIEEMLIEKLEMKAQIR